jgi:putative spermidine/putrescine transport system ATP-binding protein
MHFMGAVIRIRAEVAGSLILLDTFNRGNTPPPQIGEQTEISISARDFIILAE